MRCPQSEPHDRPQLFVPNGTKFEGSLCVDLSNAHSHHSSDASAHEFPAIGGIVFACTFGGALIGMVLRGYLSEHHLNADTKDVIKFSTGVISTMAALVLGLLVGSAKATFDTQREGVAQLSASIVYLDRVLAQYVPEAEPTRETLRSSVVDIIERVWPRQPSEGSTGATLDASARYDAIFDQVQALTPKTDAQRALQGEASNLSRI